MSYSVSIALCTYNGEKYILQQLESIINQSLIPCEVVICDDSSTDNTISIIRDFVKKYNNIKWLIVVNELSLGVTKNFEQAISLCHGDIILTCDQDDVWMNNKIYTIVNEFIVNPNLLLLFSDATIVDESLTSHNIKLWDVVYPRINQLATKNDFLNVLIKDNIMTGMTMAFRRRLYEISFPFDNDWMHDYWLAITGTLIGEVKALDESLVLYRQHSNNVLGAKKQNYITKVRSYFKNINNLQKIREKNYKKLSSIYTFINRSNVSDLIYNEDKSFIEKGYQFWSQMNDLSNQNFYDSTKTILINYFSGNYHAFYAGFRGLIRDLFKLIGG